jgi:hypothetical protein
MWIRTAFWMGTIRHGHEREFRDGINQQMIPGIKALPGVLGARALWPQRPEVGAPAVASVLPLSLSCFARRRHAAQAPARHQKGRPVGC